MTRPIGEVFTFFDHKYVVVEDDGDDYMSGCGRCELHGKQCGYSRDVTGDCEDFLRTDWTNVHFEKFGVDF